MYIDLFKSNQQFVRAIFLKFKIITFEKTTKATLYYLKTKKVILLTRLYFFLHKIKMTVK